MSGACIHAAIVRVRSRGLDEARAADALTFLRTDSVFTRPTGRMRAVSVVFAIVLAVAIAGCLGRAAG